MSMDSVLPTFIAECRELLAGMEGALLELERNPGDGDAIGATFRAIHTIKGSAGLFGFDAMVAFAHVAETVLDRARAGAIPIDDRLTALLLECGDHLGHLVAEVAGEAHEATAERDERGARLLARLQEFAAAGPVVERPVEKSGGCRGLDAWHISLRFAPQVLQNGMDPAAFLRYLGTLGELVHVSTLWDAMPAAAEMDPEACYLGFEIAFRSDASREAIESAFEFVRDDCRLRLIPPDGKIGEYLSLIAELPEGPDRIGEILVASGALTRSELEEALRQQETVPDAPRLGQVLVEQEVVNGAVVQAALEKQQKTRDKRAGEARFVRVDAAKLEDLIDQVGELVIAGASANLLARRASDGSLNEAMSLMGRLVEQIRDRALSLRMVEIGDTFHRFQRVVRDVSREIGKDIELVISGADTELDKTVVEKINDPLLHLVRNAMDHGIEATEARLARGKPARGRVSLNAYHESGSIVIEVGDDGGGLDRERILAKGIERGLVVPGASLSDQDVFQLIFEPGFSTAAQVTNLSGRGVGMDVVKRNINALRGNIELMSRSGEGTTVRIRLPLTLAIIDGFLIEVGASSFVLPLDTVQECLELSRERAAAERTYLDLRGEVLPLVRLRQLLAVEGPPAGRENVVVVHCGGRKAGLVVDRLLGEFQTVIKPLGQIFRHLKGISGSTILGSGEVALILDVPALVEQAAGREALAVRGGAPALPAPMADEATSVPAGT